jgi:hypothetical protein
MVGLQDEKKFNYIYNIYRSIRDGGDNRGKGF